MKVTSYYPIFYAVDIEAAIKRYEEDFGFEVKHHPEMEGIDLYVLGVGDGTRINLVHFDFPEFNFEDGAFMGMRVNVDDFDEGVAYFEGQGYKIAGDVQETESFKVVVMKSERDALVLFYHKK